MRMHQNQSIILAIMILILCGCSSWEHASVTVSYHRSNPQFKMDLDAQVRKDVEQAFDNFAEKNGYKCQTSMKHKEDMTCSGPKELYLTFKPSVNKPEFIATFSWMDLDDRTHEEFKAQVLTFTQAMTAVVGEDSVRTDA